MPLVPAKCPECGGLVEVDNEKRAGLCQHCGQPFVIEDAIQTFNTYYQTTNNYNTTNNFGEGTVVHINDENSINSKISSAITSLFQLEDLTAAKEKFESVTVDNASDYRGWLGLAMVESKDFFEKDYTHRNLNHIKENMKNACKTAPDNISSQLQRISNELSSNNSYSDEISKIDNEVYWINQEISKLKKDQEKYSTDPFYSPFKRVHPGLWIAIVITLLLAIPTAGAMLIFTVPLAIVAGIWFAVANKSINEQVNQTAENLKNKEKTIKELQKKKDNYMKISDSLTGIIMLNNLDKSIFNS